jgi:hypothetical protein
MSAADLWGIAGVGVGVVGIVVAVVLARRRAMPVYQVIGNRVIRGLPADHITVQYNGQDVPQVTRTRITFWNAGKKTLDGADVVEGYPIRFLFSNEASKVLDVSMLKVTNIENQFSAMSDDKDAAVRFDFDYLDFKQGAVVEILHTDESWRVRSSGTIKGLPKGVVERRLPLRLNEPSLNGSGEDPILTWATAIMVIGSLLILVSLSNITIAYRVLFDVILVAIAAALVWRTRIRYAPRTLDLDV